MILFDDDKKGKCAMTNEVKELISASQLIKKAKEEEAAAIRDERIKKRIDSITWTAKLVAQSHAPEWIQKEEAMVTADIKDFLMNKKDSQGKLLKTYLEDGSKVTVFYGPYNPDACLVRESYGAYLLSFERSLEEGKAPYVLKITSLANGKLSKKLCSFLMVEHLARPAVEAILNQEKGMKLQLNFVCIETFGKKVGKNTRLELAKTEIVIGECTRFPVDVVGYAKDGKVWLSRTDWYEGSKDIPEQNTFDFNLRYVVTPNT